MSTSANIIFASSYHNSDMENLDVDVSQEYDYVNHGNQIYIHFDGYPEHIVPILKKFLKFKGAKVRREDNNYLSAWFVTYYCMEHKLRYLIECDNVDFLNYIDYYKPYGEDIMELSDFEGVGIHNGDESLTDYTYVITNVDVNNFNIWIYDNMMKFIELV